MKIIYYFSDRFNIEKNVLIYPIIKKVAQIKNKDEETLGMQGAFHLNGKKKTLLKDLLSSFVFSYTPIKLYIISVEAYKNFK